MIVQRRRYWTKSHLNNKNLPIALMILHNCCKGCETVAIFTPLRQELLLFPVGMISPLIATATQSVVLHFISHDNVNMSHVFTKNPEGNLKNNSRKDSY